MVNVEFVKKYTISTLALFMAKRNHSNVIIAVFTKVFECAPPNQTTH